MSGELASSWITMDSTLEDQYPIGGAGDAENAVDDSPGTIADSHLASSARWTIDGMMITSISVTDSVLTVKDADGTAMFTVPVLAATPYLPFPVELGPFGLIHDKQGGFTIATDDTSARAMVFYRNIRNDPTPA